MQGGITTVLCSEEQYREYTTVVYLLQGCEADCSEDICTFLCGGTSAVQGLTIVLGNYIIDRKNYSPLRLCFPVLLNEDNKPGIMCGNVATI